MAPLAQTATAKVGYVIKRFPRLSETFIINEIAELERQGAAVEIFSLLEPTSTMHHAALEQLRAPVTYLPQSAAVKSLGLGTAAGGALPQPVAFKNLWREPSGPGGGLFPGKNAKGTARLLIQAATLAAVANMRGIAHLHAHFATDATTVAMLAGRLSGLPYSFTAHAKDIFHTYSDRATDDASLAEKLRGAAFVATVSDYNRRHLAALAGRTAAANIFRLYNGVDLAALAPAGSTVAREPALVLGVGRLIEKKGFGFLIDACAALARRRVSFRCLIIGDGPGRQDLERRIAAHGLAGQIELAGSQAFDAVAAVMRRATVLAAPCIVGASGDRDGLPTVLLEALALGLPVISTDIAGIPEIVEHEATGLLTPAGDAAALAEAIARVLGDPALADRLAQRGRAKAKADFDLRRNVATLRSHFQRAASAASAA